MTTYVKVCGLRHPEEAEVALAAGADAIGVVFSQKSPRRVSVDEARAVVAAVAGRIDTVVVTNDLDAAEAAQIAREIGASVVQLHGSYTAEDFARARAIVPRVWRATSLAETDELTVGAYGDEVMLLDAPRPGSGERWDLSALAAHNLSGRWLLAGGLNPDNVAAAIADVHPWGVDVSSGVESAPGVKDLDKIRAFVASARGVSDAAAEGVLA